MQLKNLLSEGTMYGIGEKELLFIVIPIICSILSYSFAKKKGRSAWGWALASLFIPPLIIVILVLNPTQKIVERDGKVQCPYCKSGFILMQNYADFVKKN